MIKCLPSLSLPERKFLMKELYPGESLFGPYTCSFDQLRERADRICASIDIDGNSETVRMLTRFIDLTTLEGFDTPGRVAGLCRKGRLEDKGLPDVAAICIYPSLIDAAKKELQGTGIALASVAGGFPSGQTFTDIKVREVERAVSAGADEVDVVINRGLMIEERYAEVFEEVSAMKKASGEAHLKVILEISELPSVALIRKASEICLLAGADFLKTSTGKSSHGATPEGFLVLADTIAEYHGKTGKRAGVKAAGGIRTVKEALCYYFLTEEALGDEWLTGDLFRIGASSLLDAILEFHG